MFCTLRESGLGFMVEDLEYLPVAVDASLKNRSRKHQRTFMHIELMRTLKPILHSQDIKPQ